MNVIYFKNATILFEKIKAAIKIIFYHKAIIILDHENKSELISFNCSTDDLEKTSLLILEKLHKKSIDQAVKNLIKSC